MQFLVIGRQFAGPSILRRQLKTNDHDATICCGFTTSATMILAFFSCPLFRVVVLVPYVRTSIHLHHISFARPMRESRASRSDRAAHKVINLYAAHKFLSETINFI
jgi:hypothetical protein